MKLPHRCKTRATPGILAEMQVSTVIIQAKLLQFKPDSWADETPVLKFEQSGSDPIRIPILYCPYCGVKVG